MKFSLKQKFRILEFFTVELLVAASLCMLSILVFAFIVDEAVIEREDLFDARVFAFVGLYTTPVNTLLARFITFFGTGIFLIPAYLLIVIYFIKTKRIRYAILVAVVVIVSMLSGWLLKEIFHRPRPGMALVSGAGGYSFPSGHSLGGFTFGGLMIYLIWRSRITAYTKWVLIFFLFVFSLLIGLSRIYLHVHFASDVLGSLFVTIIWLSLSFILLQVIENKFRKY